MGGVGRAMLRNAAAGKGFVVYAPSTSQRRTRTKSRTSVPKKRTPPTESRTSVPKKSFSHEDILSATNNFSDENLITEDALGKVYKGQLLWNREVMNFTVRILGCTYGLGDEMQIEISTLNGLKHKNIISILGAYDDKNEKIIIYEQAFHGTLDQHLNNPNLKWSQRLQICLGVARAINYIHYDIIHCDINSSKIFLNEDWEPKIYGFELCTKYPQSWRHRLLYSHYFNTNNMTPKYDVYSFGVLLLEVLCGRKPVITNNGIVEELDEIIDPNLRKQMDIQSLTPFKNIVYNCLNQQLVQRPTMDQIVKQLEEVLELQLKHSNLKERSKAADVGTSSQNLRMEFLKIPLSKIRKATSDFDEKYSVGFGGYGIVYKAELDVLNIQYVSSIEGRCKDELPTINKTVAIKRIFNRTDEQGKQGFLTEIELLTSCRHPNIVPLLGFTREAHEMILVYEYALNGSLSGYLQNDGQTVSLTWAQRIQICLDVAHGINYLHTNMEGKPRIIHRDIKSENILLDENMKAMVADFGLSVSHSVRQQVSTICTKTIAGTEFYMDPEYLTTSKYKKESDIYSFGVVLFEVLSGRVAYDSFFLSENNKGLAPIARRRFNEGTLKELIDPKMTEEDDGQFFTLNRGPNHDSFETFSKIAYQCLADTQARRPTMDVIIKELQNALDLQGEPMVLSRFQLSDIVLATDNFAETCCIGLDTNSIVYKAELKHFRNNGSLTIEGKNNGEPSGKHIPVAIKRTTSREGWQGKQEFFEELEIRTSYKHPNVVSLIGFCNEGDEKILVYEHVSKRSLDDYLKSANNMDNFTWTHRLLMCLEIASGLNHLHTKMVKPERITHIDIKSANILLDNNCEAKIAYYGISKLHPSNQEVHMKAYEDPEYDTIGNLRSVSDVYSFGVILFEIFCGRLAYDPVYILKNDKGLAPIARKCFTDGTIDRIIDPKLKERTGDDILDSNRGPNQNSLDTFLEIAYKCLGKAADRPTMGMVIQELEIALNFHEGPLKKLQMSRRDIVFATENFSEKNCVGSGGSWKAYKGELPFPQDNVNGCTTIVAKRWDSKFAQADHQFRTELNFLVKCNHENVIGLVGFCNEMDEKIIVYEHMSKGSLDRHLKDTNLTWMKRLEICIDIACGLEFLHQGDLTLKKVIHRDIKSASILLNDDWKAKVSNLELSSLDSLKQDNQGFLTEKSDIYSFGVVLYEILCGRMAWAEDCKDHSQSLGPLAKRCYEERKLDEIVFDGIKEKIGPESLATFADIAYQCLYDKSEERPTAHEVVIQLKKALDIQKDHEKWESELPEDYKEIIRMSKTPEIYSTATRKDLYDTLSKGILIQEGKVLFSLGSNGERNEMVSASQFSYENHGSHKWHSIAESRFDKVAEMLDISNLNIQIKIRSQFLSSGVNYGVHLVFKFCNERKSTAKGMYVNLTYKMGDETLNAYFATWREDEWMTIELYRFVNHNEADNTTDFEFLLKSFSECCCDNRAIYVEGVEFRVIDNVKPEENNLTEVQQVNMDPMQRSKTNNIHSNYFWKRPLLKLLRLRKKNIQSYMLSAKKALCDPFNANLYNLKLSTGSIFRKVAELLSTQVFHIKCQIESKMLLQNIEYGCYLVFKVSKQSCELHCPVKVHDLHQGTNYHTKVVYFRSPRPWNIDDVNQVPQERKDGWMEVYVWKFESNYELQNEYTTTISLEFACYEGTMSGLIVRGLELRPM